MKRRINYQYYVEGKDEKNLIDVLKRDLGYIESGKVAIFNVVQNKFTITQIRPLKENTVVILVYDTDVDYIEIFRQNIVFLNNQKAVKSVVCIPQVKNLEDELTRACNIKSVEELTHSQTKKDYKRDLISCTNLGMRLKKCDFDISKFWIRIPKNKFNEWKNNADKIKL